MKTTYTACFSRSYRDISISIASIQRKPVFEVASQRRAIEDYQSVTKEILQRCKTVLHLYL